MLTFAAVFTFYLRLTGPLLWRLCWAAFAAHWAAAFYLRLTGPLLWRLCWAAFAAHWAAVITFYLRLTGSLLWRLCWAAFAAHWAAAFHSRLTGPLLLWRLCWAAFAARWAAAFTFYERLTGPLLWRLCWAAFCGSLGRCFHILFVAHWAAPFPCRGSLGRCSGGSGGPPLRLIGPLLSICGSLGRCFGGSAGPPLRLIGPPLSHSICGSLGRCSGGSAGPPGMVFSHSIAAHWAAAFEFYLRLTGPLLWRLCRAACAALIGLWADLFVSRNRGSLGLPLAAACAIGCVGSKVSLIRRSLVDMLLFE